MKLYILVNVHYAVLNAILKLKHGIKIVLFVVVVVVVSAVFNFVIISYQKHINNTVLYDHNKFDDIMETEVIRMNKSWAWLAGWLVLVKFRTKQVLFVTCDFTLVRFVYGNSQHILIISLDFIWFSLCSCHFPTKSVPLHFGSFTGANGTSHHAIIMVVYTTFVQSQNSLSFYAYCVRSVRVRACVRVSVH